MKVVVTGAAGYVGSSLIRLLALLGHRVVAVDGNRHRLARLSEDLRTATPAAHTIEYHAIRMEDGGAHTAVLRDADAVVHLAALSSDAAAEQFPQEAWRVNVDLAVALAKQAKAARVSRFLFASTAAVCQVWARSGGEGGPASERDRGGIRIGTYVRSKQAAEQALGGLVDGTFDVVVVRLGSLFGCSPVMRWDLIVNRMALCAYQGTAFPLSAPEQVWRPLTHVEDAARAFAHLLALPADRMGRQCFTVVGANLRVGQIYSTVDALVHRELGRHITVRPIPSALPQRTGRVPGTLLRRTGWRPRRSLEDGVLELLQRLCAGAIDLSLPGTLTPDGVHLPTSTTST
jgi:nucleoside-diphosphate-sugar epimerase